MPITYMITVRLACANVAATQAIIMNIGYCDLSIQACAANGAMPRCLHSCASLWGSMLRGGSVAAPSARAAEAACSCIAAGASRSCSRLCCTELVSRSTPSHASVALSSMMLMVDSATSELGWVSPDTRMLQLASWSSDSIECGMVSGDRFACEGYQMHALHASWRAGPRPGPR
jgi:hypothetical protein